MRLRSRAAGALAAITGSLLLAACGSSSIKTVSISETAKPTSTTAPQTPPTTPTTANREATTPTVAAPTTTPATAPTTPTTPTTTTPQQSAPETRTATAPAFTEEQASAGGLKGAEAVLAAHGYTTTEGATYRPEQALSVLVGHRAEAGRAYSQAFFFTEGKFLGTDSAEPSQSITVLGHSATEVTLGYGLYRANGASAGTAEVRFQLQNGKLVPQDPIPPATSTAATSRR